MFSNNKEKTFNIGEGLIGVIYVRGRESFLTPQEMNLLAVKKGKLKIQFFAI